MKRLLRLSLLWSTMLPGLVACSQQPAVERVDAEESAARPVAKVDLAEPAKLIAPKDDFTFEPYKSPEIDLSSGNIVIKATDAEGAGYFIRTQNVSDVPQILTLSGTNVSERANLRVRRQDGNPTYIPSPNGEYRTTVAPNEKIELLIYLDKPFVYSIVDFQKSECRDCIDREGLRKVILSECPQLQELLDNGQWEQSLLQLLDWTANQVDLGISNRSDPAYSLPAHDLTYLFRTDEIEGSCGLFADYFCKILREFDIDSLTMDFGISIADSLTHVTTVVRAPNGKYYFFDPTFNATYRDQSGALVDIASILKAANPTFVESPVVRDVAYREHDVPTFKRNDYVRAQGYDFAQGKVKLIGGEPFSFFPDTPYSSSSLKCWWRDRLVAKNIDLNADVFHKLLVDGEVYSVGSQTPNYRDEFIALLKENGIKFKAP